MVEKYSEYIKIEEAVEIMLASVEADYPHIEEKNIFLSLRHTLAHDVFAARNVPHYVASAVDGYAIKSSLSMGASTSTPQYLSKGNFTWVNTGATVPSCFDCVVMVEDTSISEDNTTLILNKTLTPSANIRPIGEDVLCGQIIAREGDIVTPSLQSLFLASGLENVDVISFPKVLYIPTGDEIVYQKEWLKNEFIDPGNIVESNSLLVKGILKEWGLDVDVSDIIRDNAESLMNELLIETENYDLVLVGAGSAKGRRDHTFEAFRKIGKILFHWLLVKPGRPTLAAEINHKPIICLPGFPMSTLVAVLGIVYPLVQKMLGRTYKEDYLFDALKSNTILSTKLLLQHSSPPGISEWLRMKVAKVDDVTYSWSLTSAASSLWAISESDGISVLPYSSLEMEKGAAVNVYIQKNIELDKRAFFQGSDDPALQLLVSHIRSRGADFVSRTTGSLGGIAALSRGECHIAAAHLLDAETGIYNDSFIEQFKTDEHWNRILLFYREQGIILRKDNIKHISGIKDFFRPDVVFANRQPGSGTRVLFDYFLMKHNKTSEDVIGYQQQCITHMEAANRVLIGLADLTLGIKSVADALGLDFIPLALEPYELLIPEKHMSHPGILALLDSISDLKWRTKVERMGGYRWTN
ncbi:MAG: substrate-binding domain-containing protein [Synergistaceae bacterium]